MSRTALSIKPKSSARWTALTIGEVCRLINGRAYKKSELLDEGRYRVLRVGNFFTSDHWYFSDLELEEDKYCNKGDLLYAWSASFGPRIWSGDKTIFHYHIWKIEPDRERILRNYLFYFFEWDKELIRKEQGAGATMTHVSKGSMEARAIPLPSLEEQKRIVAVLDQAFAALDRARAHAEANLANAKELFDSARRQLLSATGSGIATSLGDEIELLVGFAFKSSRYVEAGDSIRLLRGDNIIQGRMRWDDAKHWPAREAGDYDRFSLREGDVVLAMDRPWVKAGLKRALLRAEDVPALLVQRTACLRAGARLDNRYLFQLISGDEFSRHLLGVQTGIGVPHISGQQIKDFRFTLPPLSEQRRIVSRLDELHVETKRLESCYVRQLADLAVLRQSLLQKAFSGELA